MLKDLGGLLLGLVDGDVPLYRSWSHEAFAGRAWFASYLGEVPLFNFRGGPAGSPRALPGGSPLPGPAREVQVRTGPGLLAQLQGSFAMGDVVRLEVDMDRFRASLTNPPRPTPAPPRPAARLRRAARAARRGRGHVAWGRNGVAIGGAAGLAEAFARRAPLFAAVCLFRSPAPLEPLSPAHRQRAWRGGKRVVTCCARRAARAIPSRRWGDRTTAWSVRPPSLPPSALSPSPPPPGRAAPSCEAHACD